ncbi:MAG: hypothetical protein U0703_19450 [Anaerolineae bacterium]
MLRANNQAVNPATLSVDAYVGLDDHLLHRVAVHLDMQIDPSAAGYADAPFTVTAAFDATLRDQNQPQTVAAPDDAAVVTVFAMPLPEPQPPGDGRPRFCTSGRWTKVRVIRMRSICKPGIRSRSPRAACRSNSTR